MHASVISLIHVPVHILHIEKKEVNFNYRTGMLWKLCRFCGFQQVFLDADISVSMFGETHSL